ncbi:hypothetical protein EGJ58_22360 [Brucella anthropi]|nr:hypothetical protein EGJ58_22360 [Brucella anthropi]
MLLPIWFAENEAPVCLAGQTRAIPMIKRAEFESGCFSKCAAEILFLVLCSDLVHQNKNI